MSEQSKPTEEIIFDAAQKVFIEKGFNGARMEEIAKEAGINKALLHYYYRTKEKLFSAIFAKVFNHFVPRIVTFIESDATLFDKIKFFVDMYMDLIFKNPYIPNFIISEINRDPDNITKLIGTIVGEKPNNAFDKFSAIIKIEVEKGNIRPIAPEQFIVNTIGLCIFPFIARPIIQAIIFKNDKKNYQLFLENRKKEVAEFIINSIKIEK
jgi:TetR/AcrR family transcriptional regulator